MEAYHTESGSRVQDAVFSVRLNSSRLLHTRAHLRPTILDDLKELLRKAREHPFEWIETTRDAISQVSVRTIWISVHVLQTYILEYC